MPTSRQAVPELQDFHVFFNSVFVCSETGSTVAYSVCVCVCVCAKQSWVNDNCWSSFL